MRTIYEDGTQGSDNRAEDRGADGCFRELEFEHREERWSRLADWMAGNVCIRKNKDGVTDGEGRGKGKKGGMSKGRAGVAH